MLSFWLKLDPDPILGTDPLKAIADGRYVEVVKAGLRVTNPHPRGPITDAEREVRRRLARAQAIA